MADYDYDLPPELIAQEPLEDRTGSRLLVLNRATGGITHTDFHHLGDFLDPGDLLVFNDSRVIPARLHIRRQTGGSGELLLLQRENAAHVWTALGRPARRLHPGEDVTVLPVDSEHTPNAKATIRQRDDAGLMHVELDPELDAHLDAWGAVPLPPYITTELTDRERYQTVYGRQEGSAAAPTAGLHFTEDMLDALRASGVGIAFVTLHVGLDTFRPVTVDFADEHDIHTEWCSISAGTVAAIQQCKGRGNRVIPVGTTSARTLETLGREMVHGHEGPFSGATNIYITPGYEWTLCDALFTNFHLPKSTLMLMVSALAGRDGIMRAYREAIDRRYRFYSFGDAMLIV